MSTHWLVVTAGILAVGVVVGAETRNGTSPVAEQRQDVTSPEASNDPGALNDVVQRVCVTCHNDRRMTGGLSLEGFRVTDAPRRLEEAEAIITKLRLDMMPPPRRPRPGRDTLIALAETLERTIDESAPVGAPGRRPIQYMNRAEYENAIREMLGLEIDADAYLPGETISEGFDNIADVQVVSGTLLHGFLRAATEVSRLAIGDPDAAPVQSSYSRSRDYAQWEHLDGAPVGSRGGIVTTHTFLADGEYVFRAGFLVDETGGLFGNRGLDEKVEVAIDGQRVALLRRQSMDAGTGSAGCYGRVGSDLDPSGPEDGFGGLHQEIRRSRPGHLRSDRGDRRGDDGGRPLARNHSPASHGLIDHHGSLRRRGRV